MNENDVDLNRTRIDDSQLNGRPINMPLDHTDEPANILPKKHRELLHCSARKSFFPKVIHRHGKLPSPEIAVCRLALSIHELPKQASAPKRCELNPL
jgi:hypothetical protein